MARHPWKRKVALFEELTHEAVGILRDKVEAAGGIVRIVVVAVDVAAVFDFAFEAVDGEVQAAEASGFVGFLDAVDGQLRCGILLMLGDEARRGDEHAARTARGVEDAPVVGLDDFGEEADDAAGGVKFATALALRPERMIAEHAGGIVHIAAVTVEGKYNGRGIGHGLRRHVNERLADDAIHNPLPVSEGIVGAGGAGHQQGGEKQEDQAGENPGNEARVGAELGVSVPEALFQRGVGGVFF